MFSRLNDVCCNEISLVCVSNEHASIAVFIDKSWRAIGCIKDCFNSCILKDGLILLEERVLMLQHSIIVFYHFFEMKMMR